MLKIEIGAAAGPEPWDLPPDSCCYPYQRASVARKLKKLSEMDVAGVRHDASSSWLGGERRRRAATRAARSVLQAGWRAVASCCDEGGSTDWVESSGVALRGGRRGRRRGMGGNRQQHDACRARKALCADGAAAASEESGGSGRSPEKGKSDKKKIF